MASSQYLPWLDGEQAIARYFARTARPTSGLILGGVKGVRKGLRIWHSSAGEQQRSGTADFRILSMAIRRKKSRNTLRVGSVEAKRR